MAKVATERPAKTTKAVTKRTKKLETISAENDPETVTPKSKKSPGKGKEAKPEKTDDFVEREEVHSGLASLPVNKRKRPQRKHAASHKIDPEESETDPEVDASASDTFDYNPKTPRGRKKTAKDA